LPEVVRSLAFLASVGDDLNQMICKSRFKSFPVTYDFDSNQFLAMIRDFDLNQIFNDLDLL